MLQSLRTEVYEANLELVRRGLVIYTFGNASAIWREKGLIVIKPSGVPYEKMTPADMVVNDLEGIGRPEVVDKIARLLLDAPNSHGHLLRSAAAGSAPQLVRASDGARAYRLYLQQGTPSARRLHYWKRNDGVIELANVGVHDAIGIR